MMSSNTSKTILLIENESDIREVMRVALESKGYRVVTAQNGQDGLEKIRQSPTPSLVLLDLKMPVMGGREFLDAVMADPILSPIPVLVLSANDDQPLIKGAVCFVKKPPNLEVLWELIKKYAA